DTPAAARNRSLCGRASASNTAACLVRCAPAGPSHSAACSALAHAAAPCGSAMSTPLSSHLTGDVSAESRLWHGSSPAAPAASGSPARQPARPVNTTPQTAPCDQAGARRDVGDVIENIIGHYDTCESKSNGCLTAALRCGSVGVAFHTAAPR